MTTETRMNPDVKAKWVTALRSGKYAQGRSRLRLISLIGGEDQFCCLGVLCDILGEEWKKDTTGEFFWATDGNYNYHNYPPEWVLQQAGLTDRNPQVNFNGGRRGLANLNDDGYSFEHIADWIEASL